MNYFCTLFDRNYLTRGLVLYDSLVKHSTPFVLWILCMDNKTQEILQELNLHSVKLISLKKFENKKMLTAKNNRTHQEYCWTCASSLLWYLFKKNPKIKLLSYLDADMEFSSDPSAIFKEMGDRSILIVPHRFDNEHRRQAVNGIYNVSLISFRNNREGKNCLRWWKDQCLSWCYYRLEKGRLGDQKYLDDFPKKFKGVHSLNHVGAGLAHWNISQYRVWKEGKIIYVDGQPLVFFHFQGMEIPPPFPFSSKSIPGPYSRKSPHWELLYEPYIDKIYRKTEQIKKLERDFNSGLIASSQPRYYFRLAAILALLTFRKFSDIIRFISKKTIAKSWPYIDFVYKNYWQHPRQDKLRQNLARFCAQIIDSAERVSGWLSRATFFLKVLQTYFRQDECQKLRDCALLWKLKSKQPPGSDRYIEYPWVLKQILKLRGGKVLDIGSSSASMWAQLLPDSFKIFAINIDDETVSKKVNFRRADIRQSNYADNFFDAIICVSTLEHIGVKGRYHSDQDAEGDFKAMSEIHRIIKPTGTLFLTIPYGAFDVLPINRLYNQKRLKSLLSGWKVEEQEFIKFDNRFGYWLPVSEKEAAKTNMIVDRWYALALITARKI